MTVVVFGGSGTFGSLVGRILAAAGRGKLSFMESIRLSEFKIACDEVIERVYRTGEPVMITRSGEPLAEIVPATVPKLRRSLGSMRGSGRIVGDIISPVSDEADWDVLRS